MTMKPQQLAAIFAIALSATVIAAPPGVPKLNELAADWMEVGALRNFPSVYNFAGGLKASSNLTMVQCLTLPPYAQGGGSAYLLLDGKPFNAEQSKWYPYQVLRRSTVEGVTLESAVRMPMEQTGLLTRLSMKNTSAEPRTLKLSMELLARIRLYSPEHWRTWGQHRPRDGNFTAKVMAGGRVLTIADQQSTAVTSFAFVHAPTGLKAGGEKGTAEWTVTLEPGQTRAIEYAITVGKEARAVADLATKWVDGFSAQFALAKSTWEDCWQATFTPGDPFFSGHYPTLVTDDEKIRRVYYHSALVPLLLCRTTFPFSARCFVTCGPQYANTLEYFWDTEMWANSWAMLEPTTMKAQLTKWLALDRHACYAVDCISGKGAGPWYAANDLSIFRCLEAYLDVTGDSAFLQQISNGKSVLQHMDDLATYYEKLPLTKDSPLADWGGPDNLLECSPSYIQGVASLNAASVYMLRRAAKFQEQSGNTVRAKELRAKASQLLPAVLALYEPGQGVWNAVDKDGKKVPIRHCYDYIVTGQALENDLTPQVKSEMNSFVENELRTKTWMRAMSLKDPAAARSDRPDHGPLGSYDGWPAMTMDVQCRFGAFDQAVDFLRVAEAVTHEASFSQSHEFLGKDARGHDPLVRVSNRGGQDVNGGCGAAYAEVIIRSFFGFRSDLSGKEPFLLAPKTPRGFSGELRHVSFRGAQYTITSDSMGVRATKE